MVARARGDGMSAQVHPLRTTRRRRSTRATASGFPLRRDRQDAGPFGAGAAAVADAGRRTRTDPVPDLHQGRRRRNGDAVNRCSPTGCGWTRRFWQPTSRPSARQRRPRKRPRAARCSPGCSTVPAGPQDRYDSRLLAVAAPAFPERPSWSPAPADGGPRHGPAGPPGARRPAGRLAGARATARCSIALSSSRSEWGRTGRAWLCAAPRRAKRGSAPAAGRNRCTSACAR